MSEPAKPGPAATEAPTADPSATGGPVASGPVAGGPAVSQPDPWVATVLVANRGEIARRVIRTCTELGIGTVAVYSDADAGAAHAGEANTAVHLPGSAAAQTYLRGDLLIDAARAAGADAVHPGYGFLSESAAFAEAVVAAGLTWLGPPPEAIAAMGSKVEAKRRMAAAGVPVLAELDPAEVTEADLPVLVKASAGGGGRGMRVVHALGELPEALAAAEAEAAAAFGDATVFCERYLPAGRHIEVQVLADRHGTVWALPERECSIQRRHQKVVEETPSPAVGEDLRGELAAAARAAAKAVDYRSAGTIEFLLTPDGQFAFLEMNTRLQVEHPITEAITGLDLVAWQIRIAEGAALPATEPPWSGHAIEVRLYAETVEFPGASDSEPGSGPSGELGGELGGDSGSEPGDAPGGELGGGDPGAAGSKPGGDGDDSSSDFGSEPGSAPTPGRPPRGGYRWTPHTGTLHRFEPPPRHTRFTGPHAPGLRVDAGVESGAVIGPHYDPMLAKLIAVAGRRAEAARMLAGALVRTVLHGVATNRELLVGILRHPAFLAGATDTAFLDTHDLAVLSAPLAAPESVRLAALATALADAEHNRAQAAVLAGTPSGWRNVAGATQRKSYTSGGQRYPVDYRLVSPGLVSPRLVSPGLAAGGLVAPDYPGVALLAASPREVRLRIGGIDHAFAISRYGEQRCVDSSLGPVTFTREARFADPQATSPEGSMLAPMPGTVLRVAASVGARVAAGEPVLWLEAMKMEHTITAPASGILTECHAAPGQQVELGAVLAVVEPAEQHAGAQQHAGAEQQDPAHQNDTAAQEHPQRENTQREESSP